MEIVLATVTQMQMDKAYIASEYRDVINVTLRFERAAVSGSLILVLLPPAQLDGNAIKLGDEIEIAIAWPINNPRRFHLL